MYDLGDSGFFTLSTQMLIQLLRLHLSRFAVTAQAQLCSPTPRKLLAN